VNRRLLITGGIALLAAAALVVRFWPQPSSRAEQVAAEARAQLVLPAQLDAITRLETIEAVGDTIVYQYTLASSDSAVVDQLRDGLARVVCSKPELQQLLAQGLALEYRYRMADSTVLPPIGFTAASCVSR
jgi:hypothetical protein